MTWPAGRLVAEGIEALAEGPVRGQGEEGGLALLRRGGEGHG